MTRTLLIHEAVDISVTLNSVTGQVCDYRHIVVTAPHSWAQNLRVTDFGVPPPSSLVCYSSDIVSVVSDRTP